MGLNPDAPSFKANTPTLYVDARKPVLLQTTQAILYNPEEPPITIGVRTILDPGSQRSYITHRVKLLSHFSQRANSACQI